MTSAASTPAGTLANWISERVPTWHREFHPGGGGKDGGVWIFRDDDEDYQGVFIMIDARVRWFIEKPAVDEGPLITGRANDVVVRVQLTEVVDSGDMRRVLAVLEAASVLPTAEGLRL
jgi:hypothetical protein